MGQVPSSQLKTVTLGAVAVVLNANLVCSKIDILNNTGKLIDVTQYDNGVAGDTYRMPLNSSYRVEGIENANQVKAVASDGSAASLPYRFYA